MRKNLLVWAAGAVICVLFFGQESTRIAESQSCPTGWSANNLGYCAPDDIQSWLDDVDAEQHGFGTPMPRELPPGTYTIATADAPITISSQTRFIAHGVRFNCPASKTCLKLTTDADHSIIEGLTLVGPAVHDTGSKGIVVYSHGTTLRDVSVDKFKIGVLVDGTTATGSNVNGFRWMNGQVWQSTTGLQLQGADANGFVISAVAFKNNRRAIDDDSFLGGTYVGIMSHPDPTSYTDPVIRLTNENQSCVMLGTYVEGNREATIESDKCVAVGGNMLRNMDADNDADLVGEQRTSLDFRSPEDAGGVYMTVEMPLNEDTPIRWTQFDGQGGSEQWQITRFSQKWCVTTGGSGACEAEVEWPVTP